MNEIKVFNNAEFGNVRTLEADGKVLFCGADVATALGYTNPRKAILDHCKEDGVTICDAIDSMGRTQQAKFITEGNLYRLITHSKLPGAERFESWVFDEVLPTIRRHGAYQTASASPDKTRALEVKEMNARVRMSNQFLKLANVDTLSTEYKSILVAKSAEVLAGEPLLPMHKSEQRMYSATEIGEMFGVSKQKIGSLSNKYGLKTEEYGEWYRDKSPYSSKEVDSFRYNDRAVERFRELLG